MLSRLRRLLGVELVNVSAAERLVAATTGGLSLLLLAAVAARALPEGGSLAVIGSMAASAVLLFAVPHGPLSQPWPVLAGHTVSALIGVACARWVPGPDLATAVAVGLSIAAMLALKCVHPPGGATAFTAVAGGAPVHDLGFAFVLYPVLLNALVMVALAVALNAAFRWRRYPAVLAGPRPAPAGPQQPTHEQVLAALRAIDSFVDVSEDDLLRLADLLRAPPPARCPTPGGA